MFGQHEESVRVHDVHLRDEVEGRLIRESYTMWTFETDEADYPLMQYGWNDEEGKEVGACARYGETPWGVALEVLVNGGAAWGSSSSWGVGVWYMTEPSQDMYSGEWEESAFHLSGFSAAEEYLIWLAFGGAPVQLPIRLALRVGALRAKWGVLAWAWDWRDEVEYRFRKVRRGLRSRLNHVRGQEVQAGG